MRLRLILSLLLFAAALAGAHPAAALSACGGRDLIAAMKREAPETYARIRTEGAALVNSEANLWRVERPDMPASYLFATVHVTDPRITGMPEAARDALALARTVAVEATDVNYATRQAAISEMAD